MRNFLKNTSGNVITTTAILIVPLVITAGSAIDYSQFSRKQSKLQNVTDSAALAVSKELQIKSTAEIEVLVDNFMKSNLDAEQYAELKGVTVNIPTSRESVTVTANGEHPTTLMQIAGINKLAYSPSSTVGAPTGDANIVLVLDSTGSMRDNNKIGQLKISANQFIEDTIRLNNTRNRLKIGIVPFARYVNVGVNNRNEDWIDVPTEAAGQPEWNGCVGSRNYPRNLNDEDYSFKVPGILGVQCPTAITPMTIDENTLKNQVNALDPAGSTYIAGGLTWGLRTLSSSEPFTEGQESPNPKQIIILMSDGDNRTSVNPDDKKLHNGNNLVQANQYTREICDTIKANDVALFTIGFGKNIPSATLQLLKECSTNGINFFNPTNGTQLSSVFGNIFTQISKLTLSQ